jgi:hypothetical protein
MRNHNLTHCAGREQRATPWTSLAKEGRGAVGSGYFGARSRTQGFQPGTVT